MCPFRRFTFTRHTRHTQYYDTDIVPIWGSKDAYYQTQASVVIGEGAGNVRRTQFCLNAIIRVQGASAFKTGDYVILYLTCGFGWNNGVSIQQWCDAWIESASRRIARIDGNCVDLQNNAAFAALDDKYAVHRSVISATSPGFLKFSTGAHCTRATT